MRSFKREMLHSGLVALGLIYVLLTGVDLDYHRVGWGVLLLGASLFLVVVKLGGRIQPKASYLVAVGLAGSYFIGRSLLGGPVGLAVSESFLVVIFLGIYFAISQAGSSFLKVLLFAVVGMSLAQIAASMIQWASERPFYVFSNIPHKLPGLSGFFGHYNPFAAFCNVSLLILLPVPFLVSMRAIWKVGLFVVIGFLVAATWFSGSRGGWLGLTGGVGVSLFAFWWTLQSSKSPRASVAGIIAVVGLVVGLSTSWAVISYKTAERLGDGSSAESSIVGGGVRASLQGMAFDSFLESPVVGHGARAFSYKVVQDWDMERLYIQTGDPSFAHNEYLETLTSYGFVGFILVLFGLGSHGVKGAVAVADRPKGTEEALERAFKVGAYGGLAALLIQSYFSFLMHFPALIGYCAVLVAILARGGSGENSGKLASGSRGIFTILIAALTIFVGFRAGVTDFWARKANEHAEDRGNILAQSATISALWEAGKASKSPEHYERAGQVAMAYANQARAVGNRDFSAQFNHDAKVSFEQALVVNPYSQVAIAGLPRILDSEGDYKGSEPLHQLAVEKLSTREPHLRVNYHAGRSSFFRAHQLLGEGQENEARRVLRLAGKRIKNHQRLETWPAPTGERKEFIEEVLRWDALLDGENLYRAGHQTWMKRDPERGLALMLEAKKRYDASQSLLRGHQSIWNVQSKSLLEHIATIKAGKISPAEISGEEVERIAAGLESASSTR
jgi:O-antigen ligase